MQQRAEYLAFRNSFLPARIQLVIVAESPPASGKYFYNPTGAVAEPLFAGLMLQLGFSPDTKENGLREFQRRGWLLVDATYEPVNALRDAARDQVITRDYPLLRDDLAALLPDKSTPLILLKANVCRLLEHKLTEDGFNVLNNGRVVYFPSTGRQNEFQLQFSEILKSTEPIADENAAAGADVSGNTFFSSIKEFATNTAFPALREFTKEVAVETLTRLVRGRGFEKAGQRYGAAYEMADQDYVDANEIADEYGLDRKRYRQALREQADDDPRLSWHAYGARWVVEIGSPAHDAMIEVAEKLAEE